MKFLYAIFFYILAQKTWARGLPDFFAINPTDNSDTRPNSIFPFFGRLGDFSLDDYDDEETTVPVLPSFPSRLFFLDPSRYSTLAGLPGNSIGRNANPNGEGRVLGALLALRAISNRGQGGIIINTPLNLTNVNTNTVPAPPPTVTTVATAPTAAAAAGTRIIPFPVPASAYSDRRSQNDNGNVAIRPVHYIRRRPVKRRYKKPAALTRVQYLRL